MNVFDILFKVLVVLIEFHDNFKSKKSAWWDGAKVV